MSVSLTLISVKDNISPVVITNYISMTIKRRFHERDIYV